MIDYIKKNTIRIIINIFLDGTIITNKEGGVIMALVHCPDCGKQVSSTADSCPFCGCTNVKIEGYKPHRQVYAESVEQLEKNSSLSPEVIKLLKSAL